ncbi:MAG: hypothetical protein J7K64_03115, partial [Bacteroidales bacterium]|nr:hypothetical protein [Bacteroidales bacterium]
MKTLKLTLISFFLIFSFSGYTQTTWTGNNGTSFIDINNWDNGIPTIGSIIIFNKGGDTHVTDIPDIFSSSISALSGMIIQNNTNVYFDNSATDDIDFYVDNIEIEGSSSLHLTGTESIDIFTQTANIYGTLDAGDIHIFSTFGTGPPNINFKDESNVITANSNGFEGSIQGSYNFTNLFSIYYNGTSEQSTGLLNNSMPIGNI